MTADSAGMTAGIAEATYALEDYEDAETDASIAMMRRMDTIDAYNNVLQHSTSIMGQSISNLQEFGLATDEQYEKFRRFQIALELVLVPLEIYMMYQQFAQARTMGHTGALMGQTAATNAATASTWRLNAALYANPVVILVVAVLALVAALYVLERKFGIITRMIQEMSDAIKGLFGWLQKATAGFENLTAKAGKFADMMKFSPFGMGVELYGGVH